MPINLKLLTIANSFLLNIAEHENFSANKYENADYCLLAEKISCSAELSMKKFYILEARYDSLRSCLTHCRLNESPHTIYWKILILILGMSGYVIGIFREKNSSTICEQLRP